MAEEFLPITVFRQREMDETRVEGMNNSDKPKWVLTGKELQEHAQSLIEGLSGAYEDIPHNEELPLVYEVRLNKMLIKHKGKYAPMKKYALDLADLTKKNREAVQAERLWYLEMKGTYRDSVERRVAQTHEKLEQEYCVIITIRDPKGLEPVYNEVPQLLDQRNFWHQSVRLANQVRAMVGQ